MVGSIPHLELFDGGLAKETVGGGLWEVRSSLTGNRIARVIFCVAHGHMVLLHGFIKKTQATPQRELEVAYKRLKEVMS